MRGRDEGTAHAAEPRNNGLTTYFRQARLIDAETDLVGDLLVQDGCIADFGANLGQPDGAAIIEADGHVLCPGLVDMRAALGEPGFEYRETIASAAQAASFGGITTIATLPDSEPAIDNPALVTFLKARGDDTGQITILPYAALSRGCQGTELAELGLLREAGAVGFTDGSRATANAHLMRTALSYTRFTGGRIVQHPEEPSLASGGAATESELALRLGLPGIPAAAEAIMVARDIALARLTGGTIHFAHVSTASALDLIRQAKAEGLQVTCDTAPPYFVLNETSIGAWRTYARLSPPLRTEADRQSILVALADGTIDAVASDHQPRDADDKRLPFAQASPGGTGLATLLPMMLTLVHAGTLPLQRAIALVTAAPASLLGSQAGRLQRGSPADLCLFHPDRAWRIEAGKLPGRAQNTPFDGLPVEGRVIGTWKAGRRVFG
jgi:dihydroorotase